MDKDNDWKPKQTSIYLEAQAKLPPELHSTFEHMVAEYQFASLKHHGRKFASPKVIAELMLMGWRSVPLPKSLGKNRDDYAS